MRRGLFGALFGAVAVGTAVSAGATETIAYWPFGENGFRDVSGNGHNLTSETVAESETAYITFDGTSQFLQTASALDLSGETAVTFECWVRATGRNSEFGILMSSDAPSAGTGGFVVYHTGRTQAQYRMTTGSRPWQIDYTDSQKSLGELGTVLSPSAGDGTWHHVAYVVNRSETDHSATQLYLDGKAVDMKVDGTTGALPAFFNGVFHIGGGSGYAAGNNFFTGCIDDVRISRGALTPDAFLRYPTVGKKMRADDGKLPVVAHWSFGGKGTTDVTGNGFDLSMSNVPMSSGTPSPSFNDWSRKLSLTAAFPFSAFSRTGLTIECYAKSGSGSEETGMIFESTANYWNNNGSIRLSYDPDYKTLSTASRYASGKTVQSKTSVETFGELNDSKWRHLALVYDPSKTGAGVLTLYVDGVAAPCSASDADVSVIALADAPVYLTRRSASETERNCNFYGSLDDVRITAGVLTPDQFLSARSAFSLAALYRFDQGTLADRSGNGNDLVLENGTGAAAFGAGDYPASGTGLLLSGKNAGKEWVRTKEDVDLSASRAMTIEIDYDCPNPKAEDDSPVYVLGASTNAKSRGGFVVYRLENVAQVQFRRDASAWLFAKGLSLGDAAVGYRRVRCVINARYDNIVYYTLSVDGQTYSDSAQGSTFSTLGRLGLSFGHCPVYYDATHQTPCYLKGKILRVTVSDIALNAEDFVLDNLVLEETKRTLAYWNGSTFSDKTGGGCDLTGDCGKRQGAMLFDGMSSAATVKTLDLSSLTQVTVECFVSFGETPASGTLFALGSGAGSFSVSADAVLGTLSGSFIPYDHLAASNGDAASLAPLAGKDAWHHVALVIDRTRPGADAVRLYVDGVRATPAGRAWDASARLPAGTLTVGSDVSREGGFFTGRIDDLRVSAGALSPDEFFRPEDRTGTEDGLAFVIR